MNKIIFDACIEELAEENKGHFLDVADLYAKRMDYTNREIKRIFDIHNIPESDRYGIYERLNEVIMQTYFDDYDCEYEYAGNYILTTDQEKYMMACDNMCCGKYFDSFEVNGKKYYFGFDYGH